MKKHFSILVLLSLVVITSCTKHKFHKNTKHETFVKTTGPASDTSLSVFSHVNIFKISDKKSLYFVSDVTPYGVTFNSEPSSDESTHNFVKFKKVKGSKEVEMIIDKPLDWSKFTEGTANMEALNQSKFYLTADEESLTLRHVCPGLEEIFVFSRY